MKLVALLPLAFLVACGRKEPIPQPEETTSTSLATENVAPAATTTLRPALATGGNGPQIRFVGRSKLRPGVTLPSTLKRPANSTEQGEKTP